MRRFFSRMLLGCFFLILAENFALAQELKVSENGRFLVDENDEPFFYLGDTAWELFHRLDRDDAEKYLSDRAAKGFTVIQAVVVSEIGGLEEPNAYGDSVFENEDPSRPNEAYFELVDDIVDMAEELGLFIGMVPTWGSYWSSSEPDRVIFTLKYRLELVEPVAATSENTPRVIPPVLIPLNARRPWFPPVVFRP